MKKDLKRGKFMDHFELVSEYKPTGDQPQAIEQLVKGFREGNQFETLLGVTGSGKTFTMANVIQALNKPTLVLAHNKAGCDYCIFGILYLRTWLSEGFPGYDDFIKTRYDKGQGRGNSAACRYSVHEK